MHQSFSDRFANIKHLYDTAIGGEEVVDTLIATEVDCRSVNYISRSCDQTEETLYYKAT